MSRKVYTLGYPFWMVFASWGYTLRVRVDVIRDDEVPLFVATSKGLRGLVCEAETLETLREDVAIAVDILLPLHFKTGFKPPHFTELKFL